MNIYTYVDSLGFLREIPESQLNFAGNWVATITYNVNDVIFHNHARYICTTRNINQEPPKTLQFDEFWSVLAFTSTGTGSSGTNTGGGASIQMVQDVYSLAFRAYNVALTGTDLPVPGATAPWVMQWIAQTYNIARAGTDAAHSADMWGRDAFGLAVTGTNSANQAYSLGLQALEAVWASTNNSGPDDDSLATLAYNIARAGTDAANQAWTLAGEAYTLAQAGTNLAEEALGLALEIAGTNVPAWVMQWLAQTYNIGRAGTDAANAVDVTAHVALSTAWAGTDAAHEADSWARDAYGLAVTGTNSANQAYSLALQALEEAWNGTNSAGVPAWVMAWLGQTYNLSTAGTAAANAASSLATQALQAAWNGTYAAHEADSWARDAFGLAVAGTNAAAAAYSVGRTALDAAWVGTNVPRAIVHCTALTPVLTGPDVGEIPVPFAYDGVTSWNWTVRRLDFRVQTAGTGSAAIIEKSTVAGGFTAITVGTVVVADNVYEGSNAYSAALGSVNSGDKLRFNVLTLGTTQNWTLMTEISHP